MDFADVDGDGDVDWLIAGTRRGRPYTRLYLQRDSLLNPPTQGQPRKLVMYFGGSYLNTRGVEQGDVALGDLNGDGLVDFITAGVGSSGEPLTDVYLAQWAEKDSVRVLRRSEVGLPGVHHGALALSPPQGSEGRPRYLALCGSASTGDLAGPITRLYRLGDVGQVSTEVAFESVSLSAPDLLGCSAAWADVDGDGDYDLALSGTTGSRFYTALFRNESGVFAEVQTLRSLAFGSLDWGDFDGDGDLDLLATGGTLDPNILRGVTVLYRNQAGTLMPVETDLPGIVSGAARFFDFDGDTREDIVLSGERSMLKETVLGLYVSQGTGQFGASVALPDALTPRFTSGGEPNPDFENATFPLSGGAPMSIGVVDYNGDGDDDFILSGTFQSIRVSNGLGGLSPQQDIQRTYFVYNPFFFDDTIPSDYSKWEGASPDAVD